MAFLFKFSIILCTFLVYSIDCLSVQNSGDLRVPDPFLAVFCNDFQRNSHTKKLACIICNGFDPSCFIKTTTTTTSSTPSTTTSSSTTTSTQPTTSSSTTTTTAAPSTRNDDDEE